MRKRLTPNEVAEIRYKQYLARIRAEEQARREITRSMIRKQQELENMRFLLS